MLGSLVQIQSWLPFTLLVQSLYLRGLMTGRTSDSVTGKRDASLRRVLRTLSFAARVDSFQTNRSNPVVATITLLVLSLYLRALMTARTSDFVTGKRDARLSLRLVVRRRCECSVFALNIKNHRRYLGPSTMRILPGKQSAPLLVRSLHRRASGLPRVSSRPRRYRWNT